MSRQQEIVGHVEVLRALIQAELGPLNGQLSDVFKKITAALSDLDLRLQKLESDVAALAQRVEALEPPGLVLERRRSN